jgi:SAM-dependent methyltransferase
VTRAGAAVMTGYETYAFIADLYDHVPAYEGRPDLDFYVDAARASGGPVLEVGCGTGRVLIPTARAGVAIVGLDFSAHMLRVCRERLLAEPAEVRARAALVRADMRVFSLLREFALVTVPFRPFQHLLTVEDQIACLGAIHRHLRDDGRLVLDLFNPSLEALANRPVGKVFTEEAEFVMPDGRRVIRRHRIAAVDRARQVNDAELIYDVTYPDGRSEQLIHAFPFRYLFRFEVEHLLARAGFVTEHLYADYDKSPFGSKYPGELLFVARKVHL